METVVLVMLVEVTMFVMVKNYVLDCLGKKAAKE